MHDKLSWSHLHLKNKMWKLKIILNSVLHHPFPIKVWHARMFILNLKWHSINAFDTFTFIWLVCLIITEHDHCNIIMLNGEERFMILLYWSIIVKLKKKPNFIKNGNNSQICTSYNRRCYLQLRIAIDLNHATSFD